MARFTIKIMFPLEEPNTVGKRGGDLGGYIIAESTDFLIKVDAGFFKK